MNNIINRIADAKNCWNERLRQCRKEKGYSQTSFAKALNRNNNESFTQGTVSRWEKCGGKTAGFPEYENMIKIANLLDVAVGYLTGETDSETFTLQKASEYLGLSNKAVSSLLKLTQNYSNINYGMKSEEYRELLDKVLSSRAFVKVLIAIKDYEEPYLLMCEEKQLEDELSTRFDEELLSTAIQCCDDPYNEGAPEPTQELCEAVRAVSETQDSCYILQQRYDPNYKVFRYELQEAASALLDEIYPPIK